MAQSAANRVYQDFDPFFEWAEDEGSATLIIMLPGFARDQLKVQVTSTPAVRINGEREVMQNVWRRFAKEFSIPPYCATNEVSAKFERGMLHVKFPKLVTPARKPQQEITATPPEEEKKEQVAPIPQKPKAEPEPEPELEPEPVAQAQQEGNNDQQKSQQKEEHERISDEKEEKSKEAAPNEVVAVTDDDKKVRTTDEEFSKTEEGEASRVDQEKKEEKAEPISEEKEKSKEAAEPISEEIEKSKEAAEPISEEKEKRKEAAPSEAAAADDIKKVRTKELSKTKETAAPKVTERKGAKMAQRLKTRMVDFTLSLASSDDKDVDQGSGGSLVTGISRPKILLNIVVAILLVMVLWTYVKNAFRSSSSSSQGGSKLQEF